MAILLALLFFSNEILVLARSTVGWLSTGRRFFALCAIVLAAFAAVLAKEVSPAFSVAPGCWALNGLSFQGEKACFKEALGDMGANYRLDRALEKISVPAPASAVGPPVSEECKAAMARQGVQAGGGGKK